jgi:hypothetical protein
MWFVNDLMVKVEVALGTVQRTLDLLTARGHHEAAFEIAKLQFAANMRASWPGNLGPLASALTQVADDTALTLSPAERADAREAAKVLHSMLSQ